MARIASNKTRKLTASRSVQSIRGTILTASDGTAGEVCSTTMPTLSRLIRDAAVQAEEEWAARHENAL